MLFTFQKRGEKRGPEIMKQIDGKTEADRLRLGGQGEKKSRMYHFGKLKMVVGQIFHKQSFWLSRRTIRVLVILEIILVLATQCVV